MFWTNDVSRTVCGVGGRTLFVGFQSFGFGWMNPKSVAKSNLVNEYVERTCVRLKLHVYNIFLSYSSLTYTLGFSRGGVRDNLIHCAYLKRKLELLQEFDPLSSHLARFLQFFSSLLRYNTQRRAWRQWVTKLQSVGAKNTTDLWSKRKKNVCLWMTRLGELWWWIVGFSMKYLVILVICKLESTPLSRE